MTWNTPPLGDGVYVISVPTMLLGSPAACTRGNTRDKLSLGQRRYGLRIPFGHEGHSSLDVYPTTMENHSTGGTPWFVAIDPDGVVLQDGFAIDVDRFVRAVAENGPTAR
jgi:hypothetical protein